MGKHSDVKPVEAEKPKQCEQELEDKISDAKPKQNNPVQIDKTPRPDFNSPLTTLEPWVNPSYKQQMDSLDLTTSMKGASLNDGEIPVGTSCKNGGCNCTYDSPKSDYSDCVYHPGVPVFHEGYKFWSCCQKRTSDFTAFMSQPGCEIGKHKWIKAETSDVSKIRWDYHQTASNVVIAIYAKMYDYKKSQVKINPIRLWVKLLFPQEKNSEFDMDLELRGIVNVEKASLKMFATKLEISLPKAEPGQWTRLNFPRETSTELQSINDENDKLTEAKINAMSNTGSKPVLPKREEEDKHFPGSGSDSDSDVDLDDIEITTPSTRAALDNFQLMEDA